MTDKFEPTNLAELKDQYDALIIGAGATGLSAAIQARELGLSVAILEKNQLPGGNSKRASSGMNASESNVQYLHGVIDHNQDFFKETLQAGGLLNDRDLLSYFVSHSANAISWLADHGIKLDDLTITGGMSKKRTHRPGSMAPIGNYLVTNLLAIAKQAEIPVFCNFTVSKLLQDTDGRIAGISGVANNRTYQVKASAVLLATGGFGASKEILAKYRPDLLSYQTTNQPGATGDGIKLAQAVDAQLIQMDLVQVHPTAQTDGSHVYLIGEAVRGEGAILINHEATRFVNELSTRKIVSTAIDKLNEDGAWLIFDQAVRDHVKAVEFYDAVGLVESAATLEELASKIDVDPQMLVRSVNRWNQDVDKKFDSEFGRTTGMDRGLTEAPYFAIHVHPAVHYTMGGIHINDKTEVIDTNGHVIKGLYAAGEVAGGLHGNNRVGGNSIAETVIFGRCAGQEVTEYVRKRSE